MDKYKKKDNIPEFPEDDMLAGPQPDITGFLVADSGSIAPSLDSPAPFSSPPPTSSSVPGSASSSTPSVPFGSPGYSNNPYACQYHGYREPSCTRCNQAKAALESMQQQPTGVIPSEARTFEPPIPNSAGLSFSQLDSTEVNPVKKTLFRYDDDDGMTGGRRKSSKKSKKKSSKKSKKSKKRTSRKNKKK